jgi:putative ABC transport system ATP-binding protein
MSNNKQHDQLIELVDVTRVFESAAGAVTAVNGVTLSLPRGAFVGVVGRSGSGKSTLVSLIAGLDHATRGSIQVGGVAVDGLGEDALALWRGRNVGVVFQFFQLLPTLTVAENVMLPMDLCGTARPAPARRRALELLDLVGIADQADKLPTALSGGQQQRSAIARALANDPPLVVADEPTGNLDLQTSNLVLELLRQLARQGRTVLMVTHERDVEERVDLVVSLADGRVVGVKGAGAQAVSHG